MAYPPPPWSLAGHGAQTIHLFQAESVAPLIPPELSIVKVLPGRTLGVFGFAHYGPGSMVEYNELIVAPALVRAEGKIGFWVSHIYVDHPDSLAGGREIWGVPKELANFSWHEGSRREVSARINSRLLCRMSIQRAWPLWRQSLSFPTFSVLDGELLRFIGAVDAKVSWSSGSVEVPADSPFGNLRFGRPWLSLWHDQMNLVCGAPHSIGTVSAALAPAV